MGHKGAGAGCKAPRMIEVEINAVYQNGAFITSTKWNGNFRTLQNFGRKRKIFCYKC